MKRLTVGDAGQAAAMPGLGSRLVAGLTAGVSGVAIAALANIAQADVAQAQPAPVFRPHLNDMVRQVPPGYPIRLPSEILAGGSDVSGFDVSDLRVQVYASQTPLSLVVSLHTCDITVSRTPCTLGTVTTDRSSSAHARQELQRHQRWGDRITFGSGVRGYLLDGSRAGTRNAFSSVAWQQDNAIYTLSFPATGERQDLLDMAASMALSRPVRATLPRSIPASVPPFQAQ